MLDTVSSFYKFKTPWVRTKRVCFWQYIFVNVKIVILVWQRYQFCYILHGNVFITIYEYINPRPDGPPDFPRPDGGGVIYDPPSTWLLWQVPRSGKEWSKARQKSLREYFWLFFRLTSPWWGRGGSFWPHCPVFSVLRKNGGAQRRQMWHSF